MLFRLSDSFLFRFAERQFLALTSQLPPRFTRSEAFDPFPTLASATQKSASARRVLFKKARYALS